METSFKKKALNFMFVVIFAYLYVHYGAPHINRITDGSFISWGIGIIIIGIWGNIAKLSLIRSIIVTKSYKVENYLAIIIGSVFIMIGAIQTII